MTIARNDGRAFDQLRSIKVTEDFVASAEASFFVEIGRTRILCCASLDEDIPRWLKGKGKGWVTAEYSLLPRSTGQRVKRERAGASGRTQEIQRLIGRSVRAMIDDFRWGEFTLKVDCDVLQADGGTRTASITGACVAVHDAFDWMVRTGRITQSPVKRRVAAVSVGVIDGSPRVDLEYTEDVRAEVDMNVVMSSAGQFVEVQGTGEHGTFDRTQLNILLDQAVAAITELDAHQRRALGIPA